LFTLQSIWFLCLMLVSLMVTNCKPGARKSHGPKVHCLIDVLLSMASTSTTNKLCNLKP
jgi:hypothetical protein